MIAHPPVPSPNAGPNPTPAPAPVRRVRVWDLPTRLFHWLLLACVVGLFATAYAPGNWIEWHARLGLTMLALLLFRLVWGVVGGHWSRFSSFLPKAGQSVVLGHSRSGALAVVVMLLALFAQVATGLVGDDEIAFTGPLNRWVSTGAGLAATAWHKGVGQWVLVGLITLHVLAIVFYLLVRRNNLIGPMVRGDKVLPQQPTAQDSTRPADPTDAADLSNAVDLIDSVDNGASRWLALAVFVLCAGAVFLVAS